MQNSGTPLAKKLPTGIKRALENRHKQRQLLGRPEAVERDLKAQARREQIKTQQQLISSKHYKRAKNAKMRKKIKGELAALSVAHQLNTKQANAEKRRAKKLSKRKEIAALHNQSAKMAHREKALDREMRSSLTALNSDLRIERAIRRRSARMEQAIRKSILQNEESQRKVQSQANLNKLEQANKKLKLEEAQQSADIRRQEMQLIRQSTAALHNERVRMLNDYLRMSDFAEDVDSESDIEIAESSSDANDDHFDDGNGDGNDSCIEEGHDLSADTSKDDFEDRDKAEMGRKIMMFAFSRGFRLTMLNP